MSRIAPPDEGHVPPGVGEILAAERERYGAPLNTTKVWARHPQLLAAYTAWRQAMNTVATAIPMELTYLVYVRVASLNGCPF